MNLKKIVKNLEQSGMIVEVKDAPQDANNFDKMIIVWLDREPKKFLYQVHFWNDELEKVIKSF